MSPQIDNQAKPPAAREERRGGVGPRSFRGRIAAGVLLIIPLAVTIILIRYVYDAALWIGVRLVFVVLLGVYSLFSVNRQPARIDPANAEWYEQGIAVVLTVIMLYMLGWLGTNVVGQRIIALFEHLLEGIPLVDTIYGSIKRMVRALSGSDAEGSRGHKVVLVDFPNENMKAIAFVTNMLTDASSGKRYAAVYVPTTPNPTSGYMELVPEERLTYTDWTKEQALSMILSGGASAPDTVHLSQPGVVPSTSAGPKSS